MDKTTVMISKTTWMRIMEIKLKQGFNSVDEVMKAMLNEVKKIGGKLK